MSCVSVGGVSSGLYGFRIWCYYETARRLASLWSIAVKRGATAVGLHSGYGLISGRLYALSIAVRSSHLTTKRSGRRTARRPVGRSAITHAISTRFFRHKNNSATPIAAWSGSPAIFFGLSASIIRVFRPVGHAVIRGNPTAI